MSVLNVGVSFLTKPVSWRTYCPGFQFLAGGRLHPVVAAPFRRAVELKIPHNYFTSWMVTPSRSLGGSRPVDRLERKDDLLRLLESDA